MNVKHIEVLVEEVSMEAALGSLLPKILGDITFHIYPYQGKHDLLANLPARFSGYASWLPKDWRVLVVVDRDNDDCHQLKRQLDSFAKLNGLVTRSQRTEGNRYQVINRIAVEELEAWYFGDWDAMRAYYEKLPQSVPGRSKYRNPDDIRGGTWEALEQLLQRAGYYKSGLPKSELAQNVGPLMDPLRNRSKSFQVFRDVLLEMVNQ